MDPDRWGRVNDLFQAAIEHAVEDRAAFLARACPIDEDRRLIERLLQAHQRHSGVLETTAAGDALRAIAASTNIPDLQPTLSSLQAGHQFRGTERFGVLRRLGAGGMGVVYECYDRTRHEAVALKTLRRARPGDYLRIKREFRSLADISHPNLVTLYELVVDDEHCFFTMELVNGLNLLEHVNAFGSEKASERYLRLRRVLRQVVAGLLELHRHGTLHRDIKPSNVLVTPEGRVVILDFGLASGIVGGRAAAWETLAGTPAYLAPERRASTQPTEAHDWYSVGVTLYEALTGRRPFDGGLDEMLRRQHECDPDPPADVVAGVPADLNAICIGLLQRDPAQRATGRDVLDLLDGDVAAVGPTALARPADADTTFVGRDSYLEALRDALAAVKHRGGTAVYVTGASGIGKSALIHAFVEQLADDEIVVLRGRCYEQETVPYKALDGVIDSLSQHLRSLPNADVVALMPADIGALARMFPVLLLVDAIAAVPLMDGDRTDPLLLRQRAFHALRDLLRRLAARRSLVVYIDDLHWADADSTAFLTELLRPPDAPPILTIACLRSEEIASQPFLKTLLDAAGSTADVILPVEPLRELEARNLVASAMPPAISLDETETLDVLREGSGNPFLLRQLAGYAAAHRGDHVRHATFAEMLRARMATLPDGAEGFLQMLSICGRPMTPELVYEASGLAGDERPLMARLRAELFVRGSGAARRIEMYHDRLREAFTAMVPVEEQRGLHARMARTLTAHGVDDPEGLCGHYQQAGDHENAAAQAIVAARKADAALAFERAAAYYQVALTLTPPDRVEPAWREAFASAQANAGRPVAAAEAFLVAAEHAGAFRRVELQRLAAEQLLFGGHIDRGLGVIRTVLPAVGLRLANAPLMALLASIWHRAHLWWRGTGFRERPAAEIPVRQLLRVDTCRSFASGLVMVDTVRALQFQARHYLLALDTGEPMRIIRAMAGEILAEGAAGRRRRAQLGAAIAAAEALAARVNDAEAIAVCKLARGRAALLAGEWHEAHECSERALRMFRDQCVGTIWEMNLAQVFSLGARLFQGELREVAHELPPLLASAHERGNLLLETELRSRMYLLWLAADKPEEGYQQTSQSIRRWSQSGFHRQHYNHVIACAYTELYLGRPEAAWRVVTDNWRAIRRTLLRRVQFVRIETWYLRARCALLMAAGGVNPRTFLGVASDDARRITGERMPWADPLARLIDASVAHLHHRPTIAETELAAAAEGFDRAQMRLHAAVARRRLAQLRDDETTRTGRREADAWMAKQDIVDPDRLTRLIAPGFADPPRL